MKTITLDAPIKRGDTEITSLTLRKPSAGELRGVTLTDVLQMDVTALIRVIPRISNPTLTEAEVSSMDPSDFTLAGGTVASFLLGRADLEALQYPTA